MSEEDLWEILEDEADEIYFIDEKQRPAFLIIDKMNPISQGKYQLYMNQVCRLFRARTYDMVIGKLKALLKTSIKFIRVYRVKRYGKSKGEKIFFWEGGGVNRCENT